VERSGPPRGEGARLAWADSEIGSGSFTLSRVVRPERVEYRVEVGGSMVTEGTISVAEEASGVRITWVERGNLGGNPLMGYWALSMDRAQGDELSKGLERLEAAVMEGLAMSTESDTTSAPGDLHRP
jgi:hypothetical protein